MRISSTLLKPAACLLLGASAVLSCSVANALTLKWATTGTNANGSGTFDIAQSSVVDGGIYTITAIRGLYNDLNISGLLAPGTIDFGGTKNDNKFQYDAAGTWKVDFAGVSFAVSNGDTYTLYCNSCFGPSFGQADYNYVPQPATVPIANQISTATASVVPAPLPILGLPAVLFYSRKLKKRIKASRETLSASLV